MGLRWGEGADESVRIGTSRQSDPAIYTDPERLALEREHVFRVAWHLVDRIEAIPEPGDYIVWERFDQSVVIARQDDGSLAAFHNVCGHRGARIVSESGHCASRRLSCPFHGFTYDLGGQVVAVPERESFDPAHLKGLRAAPVAVEVFEGWICLHLDPEQAEPLANSLGELKGELAWYGMGDWKYYGSSTFVAQANWKVVLEGFLETWHVRSVHPSSIRAGIEIPRTTYASFPPHSMMVIPLAASAIDQAPQPVEHRAYGVCHYLAFPHAFFNMYPDQGYLTTVYPIDENRTRLQAFVVASRTPPQGLSYEKWDARVASSIGYMEEIVAEDVHIAGEIGAVRHSFGNRGNLYNTLECRITAFHREIEARISAVSPPLSRR